MKERFGVSLVPAVSWQRSRSGGGIPLSAKTGKLSGGEFVKEGKPRHAVKFLALARAKTRIVTRAISTVLLCTQENQRIAPPFTVNVRFVRESATAAATIARATNQVPRGLGHFQGHRYNARDQKYRKIFISENSHDFLKIFSFRLYKMKNYCGVNKVFV